MAGCARGHGNEAWYFDRFGARLGDAQAGFVAVAHPDSRGPGASENVAARAGDDGPDRGSRSFRAPPSSAFRFGDSTRFPHERRRQRAALGHPSDDPDGQHRGLRLVELSRLAPGSLREGRVVESLCPDDPRDFSGPVSQRPWRPGIRRGHHARLRSVVGLRQGTPAALLRHRD